VDISILRNALYELTIERKVPPKVIINEAVELAKELGSEKSPSFVNAVLGKIYEAETSSTHEKLQDSQIPTE
jgi:N utilization substance protein B